MVDRRADNKCLAKRVYNALTPYVQIIGYLGMLAPIVTIAWMIFTFVGDARADHEDIATLKQSQTDMQNTQVQTAQNLIRITQQLDDITTYWQIPKRHH